MVSKSADKRFRTWLRKMLQICGLEPQKKLPNKPKTQIIAPQIETPKTKERSRSGTDYQLGIGEFTPKPWPDR